LTEPRSYHGQPVIKAPVWSWEIPCYFYTGGLAGVSAGLAWGAGLRDNDVLARRAYACSMTGLAVSPMLLISDLGVPGRFLNMLRMFKLTSPMSVGTWILSASGASTAVAAAHAWTGLFPRIATVARPLSTLLGLPLATYTAALVSDTSVPVWHEARTELPFVFASGAALSAGAAATVLTPTEYAAPARRLALAGAALELGSKRLMEHRLKDHGEPYKHGAGARLGWISNGCVAAGAALLAAKGGHSRVAAATAGVLMSAGALSARWSIFEAGSQSAADPKFVVGPQRERIERGVSAGAARTEPDVASSRRDDQARPQPLDPAPSVQES
jgi:hypothetical protein